MGDRGYTASAQVQTEKNHCLKQRETEDDWTVQKAYGNDWTGLRLNQGEKQYWRFGVNHEYFYQIGRTELLAL